MPFNPFEDVRQPCKTEGCPRKEFKDGYCVQCTAQRALDKRYGWDRLINLAPETPVPVKRSVAPPESVRASVESEPTGCIVPDCGAPIARRGYCAGHLASWVRQWIANGPSKGLRPDWNSTFSRFVITCKEPGCNEPQDARELCSVHYKIWYREQLKLNGSLPPLERKATECIVPGCPDPLLGRGFCRAHYHMIQSIVGVSHHR